MLADKESLIKFAMKVSLLTDILPYIQEYARICSLRPPTLCHAKTGELTL